MAKTALVNPLKRDLPTDDFLLPRLTSSNRTHVELHAERWFAHGVLMPNLSWNIRQWDEQYRWDLRGEEWSTAWGSSEAQWFGTLYPRIHRHLPAARILEIAPGFGRWTRYLLEYCEEYTGIDLSSECVSACQETFRKWEKARFFKNDGLSLADASGQYDFVFSFDSLVHADTEVFNTYVPAILRVLKHDGVAFIHHSNFIDSGETKNVHHRSEDVSASILRRIIEQNGGAVLVQETVNWGSSYLIDCLTTFATGGARAQPIIFANNKFMDEASNTKLVIDRYSSVRRTTS
jgi:SAM-dependent methyltransferase